VGPFKKSYLRAIFSSQSSHKRADLNLNEGINDRLKNKQRNFP
jgi:hypothetical protein